MKNKKTDTPRTDALMQGGCIAINILEHARELEREVEDFARQLERELAISLENQCNAQAEVARLRELLKRSVEIAETACKYLDTGGWNEDEEYSGKEGWVTETEINEVCATLAALKSEIK
jgi:hypothetical protein